MMNKDASATLYQKCLIMYSKILLTVLPNSIAGGEGHSKKRIFLPSPITGVY